METGFADMTPEEWVRYADQAQAVLDNPAFIRAFNEMELGVLTAWKELSPSDQEAAYELKLLHHALREVKSLLTLVIKEGRFEAEKLKERLTH